MSYRRVASFKTAAGFAAHLAAVGAELPLDETMAHGPDAPLARPLPWHDRTIGNRWSILPMEGWDGTEDGRPGELTTRRWQRFGLSGAKLIWGGEAVAVRADGRANPNQLLIDERTVDGIAGLRAALVAAHEAEHGRSDDLLIGLQLTHSGRFARPSPDRRLVPRMLYRHPVLDAKYGIGPDVPLLTDEEIDEIVADFVRAAVLAQQAGFDFVDIKHCHGYLGHEFLSAVNRPGRYGGSFANRTRFLRDIVTGIRARAPVLGIGVRLSAFDLRPFAPGEGGQGEPVAVDRYGLAFGGDDDGLAPDLAETDQFLDLLEALGVTLVNLTAGSPYYNPHIQRPALFPPSDGYLPPHDPLVDVARQVQAVAELKQRHPGLILVGSGYSYLQDWLPNVAQAVVRQGMADAVGIGRMALSYPQIVADSLAGRPLQRKLICRTFSDCTTAPRHGLVSGCYPLDAHYRQRPEAEALKAAKA